jgi:glycosyltransferase involved in cell wall biosynthesis
MKPLIITALYPPATGGAATYFGDVVPQLARREQIEHVVVLTERMPGHPRQLAQGRLEVLRYLPTRTSRPQRRWLLHAISYLFTQIWFAMYLRRLVQRQGIDLVHFHTRYRGRLFYAALRRSSAPVLADLRDKMSLTAQFVGVADRVLCCGEGVRRFSVAGGFPAEHTTLIPIPFRRPTVPARELVVGTCRQYGLGGEPYILFVGDITFNKGVYDLLEAFRQWSPEHPNVRLIFVGYNREGDRFVSQAHRSRGVLYLGQVPHEEALILMRGAEIVALPSRSEGLPRVILEAVALGTKVICPPGIPEFEEYLPRFVLHQVDADAIVSTLRAVWSYSGLPSYPLSRHSVNRVVEGLVSVYGELTE